MVLNKACQQNWPKMGPCMFFSPVPLTKRFALESGKIGQKWALACF